MKHPFANLIGLEVDAAEDGRSECSIEMDAARHANLNGVMHGAVSYALADTGMGIALYTLLEPNQNCATVEIKFNYFRSIREGRIRCVTDVVNKGRTLASLESRLYLDNTLVASASGTYAIKAAKSPR